MNLVVTLPLGETTFTLSHPNHKHWPKPKSIVIPGHIETGSSST